MPIPELTAEGLLPPGMHECTFPEIKQRFAQHPLWSSQRSRLCDKLEQYLAEARATELIAWVAVDGSFTTTEPEPNDIDLVVVLRPDVDLAAKIRPMEYNVVSRRQVSKRYGFDVLVGAEGSPEAARHIGFFQRTRDDREKGILKVVP